MRSTTGPPYEETREVEMIDTSSRPLHRTRALDRARGADRPHIPQREQYLDREQVELSILLWNVRGFNKQSKQDAVCDLLRRSKVDVALLTETKLTYPLRLDGYRMYQSLLKRSGGCVVASNLAKHHKVKTLGTYLAWTRVTIGVQDIHIVALYLEPGAHAGVATQTENAIKIIRSISMQDKQAKVIVGGDLNS